MTMKILIAGFLLTAFCVAVAVSLVGVIIYVTHHATDIEDDEE